jgi:hypothetical protein
MGLLPEDVETMDFRSMEQVLKYIHRAGIGKGIQLTTHDIDALESTFQLLNMALEESPVPEFEWERLTGILGIDLLARLLGTSAVSIRRYKVASRTTPDEVAARLHFLALTVGDLGGAYNEAGIRQWFDRKRVQLGGHSPAELLGKSWTVDGPDAIAVRDLARALTASSAA